MGIPAVSSLLRVLIKLPDGSLQAWRSPESFRDLSRFLPSNEDPAAYPADCTPRDSVRYSIVETEWALVKAHLNMLRDK
jgi:hypothetical protein